MSTTTETASQATPNESTEANPEANPTGTPAATLVAKTEHRRTLLASSYPLILLIALAILLGVTYLSLITGRYPVELDELFRILGKNWFGMDLKVYKPAENMLLTVRIPRLLAAGLIGAASPLRAPPSRQFSVTRWFPPTCWVFRRARRWVPPPPFCWVWARASRFRVPPSPVVSPPCC